MPRTTASPSEDPVEVALMELAVVPVHESTALEAAWFALERLVYPALPAPGDDPTCQVALALPA
jgi:hypothetical protein